MNIAVDQALLDKVTQLLTEIERVEQSRPPIEQEIQSELLKLETVAGRGDALPPMSWLSPNPGFTAGVFAESLAAAMMAIAPTETRKVVIDRARRRAESWRGLRMSTTEKERKIARLQTDLKLARARVEKQRRGVEEQTLEVQPRTGPIDHPEVWLMVPSALDALIASNGKQK